MSYRNGTYVAFAGCGTTDPTKSDRKYFEMLKAWKENRIIDFSFINSHDKTYAVSDESLPETLIRRLSERFNSSTNFLLIITEKTKKNCSNILNFEIGKAISLNLPFLIVYPEIEMITNPLLLEHLWPDLLSKNLKGNNIKAIHFPYKLHLLKDAIPRFNITNKEFTGAYNWYEVSFQEK